jgi:DNA-binding beta-propeller fold protein YncE
MDNLNFFRPYFLLKPWMFLLEHGIFLLKKINRILKKDQIIFIFTFFFLSCQPEGEAKITESSEKFGKGVFIICEGNFKWNNATMDFLNSDSGKVHINIFEQINGIKLGDVAQSMCVIDSLGFIVVNNSGKIEVLNVYTGKKVHTISGFTSPRYFLPVNSEKAFVSDLYSASIQVVDLKNFTIARTIPAFKSTESMTKYKQWVFVANWSYGNQIQVIDINTEKIVRQIKVVKEPNSMTMDKNGKLWVLSGGGFMHDEVPALTRINPDIFEIEAVFRFDSLNCSPSRLCSNSAGNKLYFINHDVYSMEIGDLKIPAQSFIKASQYGFYGLDIDPETSEVYVSDARDFMQAGIVYSFSADGKLLNKFTSGIVPGFFCFKSK